MESEFMMIICCNMSRLLNFFRIKFNVVVNQIQGMQCSIFAINFMIALCIVNNQVS